MHMLDTHIHMLYILKTIDHIYLKPSSTTLQEFLDLRLLVIRLMSTGLNTLIYI